MSSRFLHVYEDTSLGREALLQTAHFCRIMDAAPVIYIPRTRRFLMYLENRVTQVDLAGFPKDEDARKCALSHASEIMADAGLDALFLDPAHWTTASLPDISVDFEFMACPLPRRGGLAPYSDLGMRRLPMEAPFSVFMPPVIFNPWKSIALFQYEGKKSEKSFMLGRRMAEKAEVPMDIFCFGRKEDQDEHFENFIGGGSRHLRKVIFLDKDAKGSEAWMHVPHDALLLFEALTGTWLGNRLFPSFQKEARTWLPNPALFSGAEASLVALS